MGIFLRHKQTSTKNLFVNLFWLANVMLVLLWVFAFVVRYEHSGQECSGDFTVSRKEAKYLMYVEGMFLKFSSLLVLFVVVLIVVGHCLNLC